MTGSENHRERTQTEALTALACFYSREDIIGVVPALLEGFEGECPAARALLARFGDLIGARDDDTTETLAARVEQHYRDHPIHAGLLAALRRFLRDSLVDANADFVSEFQKYLGRGNSLEGPRMDTPRTGPSPLSLLIAERAKTVR